MKFMMCHNETYIGISNGVGDGLVGIVFGDT
jgi:hypothetical protein